MVSMLHGEKVFSFVFCHNILFSKSSHKGKSTHFNNRLQIWKFLKPKQNYFISFFLYSMSIKQESKSFNSKLLCLTTMSLATKSKTKPKFWWCSTMSEELLAHFSRSKSKQIIFLTKCWMFNDLNSDGKQ